MTPPGGVGFDINCGVRLLRTNLVEADIADVKEKLAQSLFDHIPVGVGSQGIIPTTPAGLEAALGMGMDWSLREGRALSGCSLVSLVSLVSLRNFLTFFFVRA